MSNQDGTLPGGVFVISRQDVKKSTVESSSSSMNIPKALSDSFPDPLPPEIRRFAHQDLNEQNLRNQEISKYQKQSLFLFYR